MSSIEFCTQFDKLKLVLFAFALNLTKDQELANDLLQETAYKAFKYRNKYEPHTNLRAWLMTIMRNAFINEYRKKKRRQTLHDHTDNNYLLDSGDKIVMNEGESNVMLAEIQEEIDALEDWVRIPFLMHYEGFKYEEIAQSLDVPLGTVKSRIFFARKKLQSSLRHIYQAKRLADITQ